MPMSIREAFTKIISNLLNNAVKYSEHYIHVFLEVTEGGENKVFCIRTVNDGVIIPREMREEIFQPFVRFNEGDDGKVTTGTGIDWLFLGHWLNYIKEHWLWEKKKIVIPSA